MHAGESNNTRFVFLDAGSELAGVSVCRLSAAQLAGLQLHCLVSVCSGEGH